MKRLEKFTWTKFRPEEGCRPKCRIPRNKLTADSGGAGTRNLFNAVVIIPEMSGNIICTSLSCRTSTFYNGVTHRPQILRSFIRDFFIRSVPHFTDSNQRLRNVVVVKGCSVRNNTLISFIVPVPNSHHSRHKQTSNMFATIPLPYIFIMKLNSRGTATRIF